MVWVNLFSIQVRIYQNNLLDSIFKLFFKLLKKSEL